MPYTSVHDAACIFPMMSDLELQQLADDIQKHGLREPVIVWRGVLLDGRNRSAACERIGIVPATVEWEGNDAGIVPWIVSRNLHRRHLSASQRAMVAARLATLAPGQKASSVAGAVSQAQAAETLGVSHRLVQSAKQLQEGGDAELVRDVETGKRRVSNAVEELARRKGSTSKEVSTSHRRSDPIRPGAARLQFIRADLREIEWPKADLVILDFPWWYVQKIGSTRADTHYECMKMPECHEIAERFLDLGARTMVWATWPTMAAFVKGVPDFKTGGSWVKSNAGEDGDALGEGVEGDAGHYGPGFHMSGTSEPVLIYSSGKAYTDRSVPCRSSWFEAPGEHSRKPVAWMRQWVERFVPPGGLVLDPFGGWGTTVAAVYLAGGDRRCVVTEKDEKRHADGVAWLRSNYGIQL